MLRLIARLIPNDVAVGSAARGKISFGDQTIRHRVEKKNPVGPLARKRRVVPAFLHQTMDQSERQRAVGARARLQEHVCLGADADAARIDDDSFHCSRARLDDVVGEDQ